MSSKVKIVAYISIAAMSIVGIIVSKDAFIPLVIGAFATVAVSHFEDD